MAEFGSAEDEGHSGGYFTTLPQPVGLTAGLELLAEAAALGSRLPQEFDQSAEIEAVAVLVERQVVEATLQTAKLADEAIKKRLTMTRVRPEASTFGGEAGAPRKRLEDAIHSEAVGLGAVGIGSIEELDGVLGVDGRPFWRTQEYGSTHNVGRVVYGLFQPGSSLPDQQQFRQHPVFVAGPGGPMHISRPIPARHFLRDGAAEAELFRERVFLDVQEIAVAEIRAIRAQLIPL
jgi:hypothetical protein